MSEGSAAFSPVSAGPFDEAPQELAAMLRDRGAPFIDQDPQGTRAAWLAAALAEADVQLGAYDQYTVGWLSGWDPAALQAIGGWVTRAAGRAA